LGEGEEEAAGEGDEAGEVEAEGYLVEEERAC